MSASGQGRWAFSIDRGGTFTDVIGRDPAGGALRVVKLLSSDTAPIEGIRKILGLAPGDALPACDVRMGTTLGTNALLERKGPRVALVITKGLGDLLEIGTQERPALFDLDIQKRKPLYEAVLEVDARLDARGVVLRTPDDAEVLLALSELRARGIDSVAIVVLHDHRRGVLERGLGALAGAAGMTHVAMSHEVAPAEGMVARGDTTLLDAYLTPLLRSHLADLRTALGCDMADRGRLRLVTSAGGLADSTRFRGPDAILSGPAAGVVAYARITRAMGRSLAIGFDMGGTSTDASRFGGEYERIYEGETAGVRVRAPRMDIHTVAAGGGSLCSFDGVRLHVGPESAGARPGPLCYGDASAQGLTLTDVNFALGRVVPDRFPLPLVRRRVDEALQEIAARLSIASGRDFTAQDAAYGFFEIANTAMAEAVRRVTLARGHDPRSHALFVFGGAGGQHACAVARRLGIATVISHPLAGVLSAYGAGLGDVSWHGEVSLGGPPLDGATAALVTECATKLRKRGDAALLAEGLARGVVTHTTRVDLRYRGTEAALTLAAEPYATLQSRFEALHRERFGWARQEHPVEATTVRVESLAPGEPLEEGAIASALEGGAPPTPLRSADLCLGPGEAMAVPVYEREALLAGTRLAGPALILESTGTLVVDRGFNLVVDACGRFLLTDEVADEMARAAAKGGAGTRPDSAADPVLVEVFNHRFMSIAEQMGDTLRRTALSTNIRERLDFSCAVFDTDGTLVANAPHIPVHLGAMGETVSAVRAAFPAPEPGDVFVCNDPARGGSHLPDVTVVAPVHDERGALRFFTANRGHHADIGGVTPGSMPPFSSSLSEEGVVLPPTRLVVGGLFDEAGLRAALARGPYPARRPDDNVADLQAQVAACLCGGELLRAMCAALGTQHVAAYMGHAKATAAAAVAAEIARLPEGERRFVDALDDGTPIAVTLRRRGERLVIDFTGTGAEHAGNLNAPRAVTLACVLYALRCLVAAPLPLNAGCLQPVDVVIPEGSILAPSAGRAVVAGNVETSQRIVDVILGALGRAAASQGTMNNVSFGDETIAYYETIGGGAGAGPGFHGCSGVHTHMTNTRITDPEVLESRFPVRLWTFAIRRGSGGAGKWRGGDGLVRELEMLRDLHVSIVSQRRTRAPFGLAGGGEGARGKNRLDGVDVGGSASFEARVGQRIRIETPGGGGFGE